jgi:hypothetical protein
MITKHNTHGAVLSQLEKNGLKEAGVASSLTRANLMGLWGALERISKSADNEPGK